MDNKEKFSHIKNVLIAVFCAAASIQGSLTFFRAPQREKISFYSAAEEGEILISEDVDYSADPQLKSAPETAELTQSDSGTNNEEASENELINVNSASSERLQELKGIGPSKAEAIIEYRKAYGDFVAKEELMEVRGIGPATYEKIKDYISVK